MSTDYPRDLAGYKGQPPHANWPNNARIALQFVLNIEEGGENCVLHGDQAYEGMVRYSVCGCRLQLFDQYV